MQKIQRALVSVSEKSGIVELCLFLTQNSVEIISTGGTYSLLLENKIPAIEISQYTNFPEMMDGRLKTLHPKVHGGLLNREQDTSLMLEHEIKNIDLVIVNLYPFEETLAKTTDYASIIEKIDIGGPSMVRSAAKNHLYKTIITNANDYEPLISHLKENNFGTTVEFRQKMAGKAFALTAYYDSIIANYFASQFEVGSEFRTLGFKNGKELRYGENPHQKAKVYSKGGASGGFLNFKQLSGKEMSYNNIKDSEASYNIASFFKEPTCAIIKHATPCGIACADSIEEAYKNALESDSTSAFGGIVSVNADVNEVLAIEISKHFFEVIIAPKFSEKALEILTKKKNLRLLELPFQVTHTTQKSIVSGGLLEQERDLVEIDANSFEVKSGTMFNVQDAIFGFTAVRFLKSNAILITSGKSFVSFGAGQTSRIDSMNIALQKMVEKNVDVSNCILSSDAFFPFKDNIELAHSFGIKNIIAPSGSIKDDEVIEEAKKLGINLIFAKTRHFMH